MDYEWLYKDLLYQYRERGYRIEELKRENNKLSRDLEKVEYRVRNELEPRIKQEQRSYDNWVTNPERQ
jgi:FtsZ-binding cell division protein ZapB